MGDTGTGIQMHPHPQTLKIPKVDLHQLGSQSPFSAVKSISAHFLEFMGDIRIGTVSSVCWDVMRVLTGAVWGLTVGDLLQRPLAVEATVCRCGVGAGALACLAPQTPTGERAG